MKKNSKVLALEGILNIRSVIYRVYFLINIIINRKIGKK
jgi:hypothetical protein